MLTDPCERQASAVRFIFNLPNALKLLKLQFVEVGLQGRPKHAVGQLVVAQAKLQSEVVANKNKPPKDFIIPHHPRRQHKKEYAG